MNSLLVTTMVRTHSCIGAPATTSCTALVPTGRDWRLHCTATRLGRRPRMRSTPQSPVSGVMITGTPQDRAMCAMWSSNCVPVISSSGADDAVAPEMAPSTNRGAAAASSGTATTRAMTVPGGQPSRWALNPDAAPSAP
ncbi:hypothetical protein A6B34_14985 [Mycolicibacterium monacense]|nr:hypothetical protein A6B34_14985 [Mycolicibacterium monacense]